MSGDYVIIPLTKGGHKRRRVGNKCWQYYCEHDLQRSKCIECVGASAKGKSTHPGAPNHGVGWLPNIASEHKGQVKRTAGLHVNTKPDHHYPCFSVDIGMVRYKDLSSKAEYQAELKKRQLPIDGTCEELASRLQFNDLITRHSIPDSHLQLRLKPRSFRCDEGPLEGFYCPITMKVMKDPVIAADGFTYDRLAIQRLFALGNVSSPMTDQLLETTDLFPDRNMESRIADWKDKNRGLNGITNRIQQLVGELVTSTTAGAVTLVLRKIIELVGKYDVFVSKLEEKINCYVLERGGDGDVKQVAAELITLCDNRKKWRRATQLSYVDVDAYIKNEQEADTDMAAKCKVAISDLETQLIQKKESLSQLENSIARKKVLDEHAAKKRAAISDLETQLIHENESLSQLGKNCIARKKILDQLAEMKRAEERRVVHLSTPSTKRKNTQLEAASPVPDTDETNRVDDQELTTRSFVLFREGYALFHGQNPTKRQLGQLFVEVAANNGYELARAYCMREGWGEEMMTHDQSFRVIREAASSGCCYARTILGSCYRHGQGAKQDKAEAAKWYKRAAEQGYARVQYFLGIKYSKGKGVYSKGKGVDEDKAEGVKWLKLAADQGYARAQWILGVVHEKGRGVDQDRDEAARCYMLAAEQGYEKAQSRLNRLEGGLEVSGCIARLGNGKQATG